MNLRPEKHAPLEVNLTPLIDVVFLLLIFFMVSTTFVHETEIKVDLPESGSQTPVNVETPLVLTIDKEGEYFFADQQYKDKDALYKAFVEVTKGQKDSPTLVIRADADSRHASVVAAMDAAARAGLLKLSVATAISTETE